MHESRFRDFIDDDEEIRKAWNDARRSRKGNVGGILVQRLLTEIERSQVKEQRRKYRIKDGKRELIGIEEIIKEHPIDIAKIIAALNELDPDFKMLFMSKQQTIDVTYNYVVDDSEHSGSETPQWTGEIPQGN